MSEKCCRTCHWFEKEKCNLHNELFNQTKTSSNLEYVLSNKILANNVKPIIDNIGNLPTDKIVNEIEEAVALAFAQTNEDDKEYIITDYRNFYCSKYS